MKRKAGFAGILCILVCIVFVNTLANGFVFDDSSMIKDNPAIQSVKYIRLYFLRPFFSVGQPASGPVAYDYYRPIVLLSFLADYHIWGLAPKGYHLSNILLHMAAAVLVFLFLERLKLGAAASFIGAALFAAHPALADSVAGVSGRSDPLCAIFFLSSCLCYAGARQTGSRKGLLLLFLAYAAVVPALLTKENAFAIPFVLTAYEFLRPDGSRAAKLSAKILSLSPVYFITGSCFLARSLVIPNSVRLNGGVFDLVFRLLTAAKVAASYMRIAFLPYGLGFETYTPLVNSFMNLSALAALFLVFLACRTVVRFRNDSPQTAFFVLWFLVCLLPYSYFFLFYPAPTLFTPPHFLYFPVIGPSALCGLLATHFSRVDIIRAKAWRKAAPPVLTALVIFFFSAQTILRNTLWLDDFTFFSAMVKHAPSSARIHIGLGSALLNAGQSPQALSEYAKAYELAGAQSGKHPNRTGGQAHEKPVISNHYAALALAGMGDAYAQLGETENSVGSYRMALSENAFDSRISAKLGRAYERAGKFDDAIEFYTRALTLDPRLADVASNLELARVKREVYDEAKRVYVTALMSHKLDSVEALYCEALMLRLSGKQKAAAAMLRKAIEKSPSHFGANLALGQILTQQGEYDEALGSLSVAYAVRPTSAVAAYEIALTKLALRDTLTAEMWAARAYELKPDDFYRRFLESIRNRAGGGLLR